MTLRKISHAYLLSVLFYSNQVFADDNNLAIIELSLEELLNTPVTTANKQKESFQHTNASISVITRQHIEQFGGQNLFEILERLVSVNSNYGVLTAISTRGSKPWTGLLQHLGLINGRPFGNLSGAHSLYTSIPLSSIERIEYIRGPGSVLYGTNAYQAVFNVITRQASNNGLNVNQSITIGSFNSKSIDSSYLYKNDDFSAALHLLYNDVAGWDAKTRDPLTGQTYSKKAFQQEKTMHIEMAYNQLSVSHFRSLQHRFANFWDGPEENYLPWSKLHPSTQTNLSYQHHFSQNWQLASHFTNIKKIMEWSSNGIADNYVRIKSPLNIRLLEFNLTGSFNDKTSLLLGINHESRKVYSAATIPDNKERYASVYGQIKHHFSSAAAIELGVQFITSIDLVNDIKNQSDLIPRLGFSYHVTDDWIARLRHAKAYRHPTSGERTIETPGIQKGTPDLRSETITTSEVQLLYQQADQLFSATLYKSHEKDLILLAPSSDANFALENKNSGEISSYGLELEYKQQFNPNWYGEVSFTHQKNKNKQGVRNTNLSPNNNIKIGLGFDNHQWQLGFYWLGYAKYHDNILFDPNRELVNPPANGYDWLTLKASRKLQLSNHDKLTISIELKNLLDEDVYQPNDTPVFYPLNTLPAREQFAAFLSINYKFQSR